MSSSPHANDVDDEQAAGAAGRPCDVTVVAAQAVLTGVGAVALEAVGRGVPSHRPAPRGATLRRRQQSQLMLA